jgi:hypothetical protein
MSSGATEVGSAVTRQSKGNNPSQSIDNSLLHYVLKTGNDLIFNYSKAAQLSFPPERRVSSDQQLVILKLFIAPLVQSAKISVTTLVAALVYIRRLVSRSHNMDVCPAMSNSIVLAALIVATKFLYDKPRPYRNKAWAKRCECEEEYGITTEVINSAERRLLKDLNWKVALTEGDIKEEYERFEI